MPEAGYFIIEHPTKGTLCALETTDSRRRGRFSWSGRRNDPETAMQFWSINAAVQARAKIEPMAVRNKCDIRHSRPDPNKVPPYDAWPVVA